MLISIAGVAEITRGGLDEHTELSGQNVGRGCGRLIYGDAGERTNLLNKLFLFCC